MKLNNLKGAPGSKPTPKRLGRGIGSGLGKTSGKGHKGQKARAGGYHKVGFEGGQMPLQRRLPKFGFFSSVAEDKAEVRLYQLDALDAVEVDLAVLKEVGIVPRTVKRAKVVLRGTLNRALRLRGIGVTQGARSAIEAAGGSVED